MRVNHRLVTALAVAGAVSVAGLAPAVTTKRYEGKIKNSGPISFRLAGSTVKSLRASVGVTCASSSAGGSESYLLAPTRSAKLNRQGRFTLRFTKDKLAVSPYPLYKINATVRGRVSGKSSSGTVEVTYYKNRLVGGRLILMGCGSGKLQWSAKRK